MREDCNSVPHLAVIKSANKVSKSVRVFKGQLKQKDLTGNDRCETV